MDLRTRVTVLSESHDQDGPPGARMLPGDPVGITRVRYPGHGSTRLMRIMQTNACSLSCGYCPTFCGGNVRRTYLAPEEVARVFMDAHRKGLADGLFLTSGVPGRGDRMTDRMLAAVELLRRREGFRGYVHLKLLPGAQAAQVEEAARLVSRISVNLESATDGYVRALSREKDLSGDLLPKLRQAGQLLLDRRREQRPLPWAQAGTTTQFVVGAAGERDQEILGVGARLERERLLHHAHFSAFQPGGGTPIENAPPKPPGRGLRLFQAEHPLRQYGFAAGELRRRRPPISSGSSPTASTWSRRRSGHRCHRARIADRRATRGWRSRHSRRRRPKPRTGVRTPATRSARQRNAWLLESTGLPSSRSSVSSTPAVGSPVPLISTASAVGTSVPSASDRARSSVSS